MDRPFKERGLLHSASVEAAFRQVPRHRLLETFYRLGEQEPERVEFDPKNPRPEHLEIIYSDEALVTRFSPSMPTSSTSQPSLMVNMLELLELSPGLKVLEIGAGTGYNAALIAELVGEQSLMVSVDIQADVLAQARRLLAEAGYPEIKLLTQDGFYGVAEEAPYDRIVATVGCPDLSPHWATQLKPAGFLLVPLTHGGGNPLVQVWREEGRLKGRVVGLSGFMLIQGELHMEGLWPQAHGGAFSAEDAQELPLFESLKAEHAPEGRWLSFPAHLYYFMAIRDRRAFWNFKPPGYGLHDRERGSVLLSFEQARVLLKGEEELYADLRHLYEEWRGLGKPGPADYAMEFLPLLAEVPEISGLVWSIERKFYRQVFRLPGRG
jgi:protein-L-isoaspartate(D-aspartate) O-methyltransferase